jgi:WD40 repeat protein
VSGSNEDRIAVWDAGSGEEIKFLKGHTNIIESLSFSRNGAYLVSGSDDGTCLLWKWS